MSKGERDALIPPEELYGAVQVISENDLADLKTRFQGKPYNPNLLTTSHDSQAGEAILYGGVLLFLEADSPKFDCDQAIQKLLGLT